MAFRALPFPASAAAFTAPVDCEINGGMISGADNRVRLLVASMPSLLVRRAHAIGGRNKPKDAYDLYYCLDSYLDGIARASRGELPSGPDSEG